MRCILCSIVAGGMILLTSACATLQRHFMCHVGPYTYKVSANDVWEAESIMTGFRIGKGLSKKYAITCEDQIRASKERVSR